MPGGIDVDVDGVEGHNDNDHPGITVSEFDYSVENHFRAVDKISMLCGEAECDDLDKSEIERLSSSITFLREWRHFTYQPRMVQFSCQSESGPRAKDVIGGVTLPQFSAATVPKVHHKQGQNANPVSPESRKDFVMYVGGPVWALDWCPRVHQSSDCQINCEFIAVAAHPPEASYHKIGVPLIGRGVIQIWCLLNVGEKDEVVPQMKKKPKKTTKIGTAVKAKSPESKRPRGRPRKKPTEEPADNLDGDSGCLQALAVEVPENSSISPKPKRPRGRPRKEPIEEPPDNLDGDSGCLQALAVQVPENSSKSSKPKSPRGSPGKKPINEPADNLDGDSRSSQAFAIIPENSSKSPKPKRPRGRPKKKPVNEPSHNLGGGSGCVQALAIQFPENTSKSPKPMRPTETPRKKPVNEPALALVGDNACVQALAVQYPENSPNLLSIDMVPMNTHEYVATKDSGRKRNVVRSEMSTDNLLSTCSAKRLKLKVKARIHCDGLPSSMQNQNGESFPASPYPNSGLNLKDGFSGGRAAGYVIPPDVSLPRVVLCLAHYGKVAWDVKWRPSDVHDTELKHRMGYLAVLLGNGALEVWEVPLPQTMKVIYPACQNEGTDPRFVKLEPVFRCSKLMSGDRQSIPLTVEWSASPPHDLILAGCHDGVVALWKFCVNGTCKDTRPLLCFSADTVPIRALAWAPAESDAESANVIVTAGHKGLKFWDIRDPYRPLWDFNTVQRIIYSLDWLPDPRCLVVSFDDGTLRILSLRKAAYDVPVTGKPFVGTQHQGCHSYYCSSSAIWNVQVSRLTGMVAYCSADGTVLRFQLTSREVEKDPLRNRAPHFLCGSLSEVESTLTVVTPLPDTPFPMKKSLNEWGDAPRTIRGFLSVSNQAKRAKEQRAKDQTLDDQTLALSYGDDPETEVGSKDNVVSSKSKCTPKSKTNSRKMGRKMEQADQALAFSDEEPEISGRAEGEKEEVGDEIDVLPPKIIAMHRVRWNLNKGSERWLCYGGAGGILRCQEIDFTCS